MSDTVSDYVVQRLHDWGIRRIYGYPGDGINGLLGALDRAGDRSELRPGPARGDGGVHGVRAREVHRRGRRVHGDLGPGRDPSAERPLRREARPPAGRRDRRAAGARRARRRLPAGGRPAHALQGRGARVRRRWRCTPAQIRHLVDRAIRIALAERTVTCIIVPNDVQELDAVEAAAARARHACTRASAGPPPRVVPDDADLRRAADDPQRGRAGRDAGRRGRAATPADEVDRGRRAARRRRGQGAARQGGAARRPAVRDRLDRPARHASRAGS